MREVSQAQKRVRQAGKRGKAGIQGSGAGREKGKTGTAER